MAKKIKKYIPKTPEEVLSKLKKEARFPDLLKVKKKEKALGEDDILISNFEEITKFVEENGREPSDKGNGPIEFTYYSRLLDIRLNQQKINTLLPHDRLGLLAGFDAEYTDSEYTVIEEVETKETKLGIKDRFDLLGRGVDNSIFKLKNVKPHKEKVTTMPEEVATRKKCKDFKNFEPLFKKCQEEIENGSRQIVQFRNEQDVCQGAFFIYGGLKCYVAEVGKRVIKNNRNNARLRLIFENGLESNMLQRSLTAELYKDGRRILPPRLLEGQSEIVDDELTGFIYVLASKSDSEAVKSIPNLHKIGFSTTPVKDRVKNAKNQATYLMAEVTEIASYKVAGIKPNYFEKLVHRLFGHVQVKIEVIDNEGIKRVPKEWFSVPYDVIDDVLRLIMTGEIVDYVYDSQGERLVKKVIY
ncbi:MAG: hypothetical protein CMJ16_01860 [Peredibacter sp.]|nr:hypothetical protein [Peredibacter sp.]